MQDYRYSGVNRFGKRVGGDMQAANPQDLEQRLKLSKIELISYSIPSKGLFSNVVRKRILRRDVIVITMQFRQLLKAGVALMDIIDDLRQSYENDAVKEMLSSIYEAMEGGESFSEALSAYEKEFGKVYISLVAIGEQTGQLELILTNLEDMLKWEENLSSKAKKVMIYPSIVGTVVLGVLMLMMVFVVPEVLGFVKEMGGEIGFATKSLLATSSFVNDNIIAIFLLPFVIWLGMRYLLKKSPSFRIKLDAMIFKIKVIGPVIYKLKIARIANSLAIMYAAGMSFTNSMRMSANVAGNTYLAQKMERAIRLIEDGIPINEAFTLAQVFPPMAIRMVKVGELSGNMDQALKNVSDFYDAEAKEMIEKIEPSIEPILTVIMAFMVGWVMMAVLGPVYDTISKVQ